MRRMVLAMVGAVLLSMSEANATLIDVNFAGNVTSSIDVLGTVGAATTLSGSFTYDTAAAVNFSSSNRTVYTPAVTAVSLTINGHAFTLGTGSSIFVDNNFAPSYDALQVTIPFQDAFGYDLLRIRFNLQSISSTLFSDTSLPSSISLADFNVKTFDLFGNQPGTAANLGDLRYIGTLTAFDTPDATENVPEPPTLPVLMLGLAGLAVVSRTGRFGRQGRPNPRSR